MIPEYLKSNSIHLGKSSFSDYLQNIKNTFSRDFAVTPQKTFQNDINELSHFKKLLYRVSNQRRRFKHFRFLKQIINNSMKFITLYNSLKSSINSLINNNSIFSDDYKLQFQTLLSIKHQLMLHILTYILNTLRSTYNTIIMEFQMKQFLPFCLSIISFISKFHHRFKLILSNHQTQDYFGIPKTDNTIYSSAIKSHLKDQIEFAQNWINHSSITDLKINISIRDLMKQCKSGIHFKNFQRCNNSSMSNIIIEKNNFLEQNKNNTRRVIQKSQLTCQRLLRKSVHTYRYRTYMSKRIIRVNYKSSRKINSLLSKSLKSNIVPNFNSNSNKLVKFSTNHNIQPKSYVFSESEEISNEIDEIFRF